MGLFYQIWVFFVDYWQYHRKILLKLLAISTGFSEEFYQSLN